LTFLEEKIFMSDPFSSHETPNPKWKNSQGQSSNSSISNSSAATSCSKIVDGKKGEKALTFYNF